MLPTPTGASRCLRFEAPSCRTSRRPPDRATKRSDSDSGSFAGGAQGRQRAGPVAGAAAERLLARHNGCLVAPQPDAAPNQRPGWFPVLRQIAPQPPEEVLGPRAAHDDRVRQQTARAEISHEFGREDARTHEGPGRAEIEDLGAHAAVAGDVIDGYLGPAVLTECGDRGESRRCVPGTRVVPVDDAERRVPRRRRVVAVLVEVVE